MKCALFLALLAGAAIGWFVLGRDLRQLSPDAAGIPCDPPERGGQVGKPPAIVPSAGDQWMKDWARGVGQRSWAAVRHHECSSEDR